MFLILVRDFFLFNRVYCLFLNHLIDHSTQLIPPHILRNTFAPASAASPRH